MEIQIKEIKLGPEIFLEDNNMNKKIDNENSFLKNMFLIN